VKRLPLVVGIVILGIIYMRIDFNRFLEVLSSVRVPWLLFAFACFIPQTVITGVRWQQLTARISPLSFWECYRQVLASGTLNVILPSKMGDLAKGYFLTQASAVPLRTGIALAAAEKLLDLAGLSALLLGANFWLGIQPNPLVIAGMVLSFVVIAFVVLGLGLPMPQRLAAVLPGKLQVVAREWGEIGRSWRSQPPWLIAMVALTIGLWQLHLFQIHLFFLSVGGDPPALRVYAFVPVALMAGLLPVTQGGFGTRDAALIYLFSPDTAPAVVAAVGLLTGTRYVVPALAGLPFLSVVLRVRTALKEVPLGATPSPDRGL
jgi:glycosyltransferase 2 family protein